MANVGALRTSISLDSAQFQQSMQGVNRQLKGLKAETKAATSSGTGFARGVTEMRSKAEILNRTLKVQEGQVKELRRRYEESRTATGDNSRETQRASEAYNKAQAEMNKTKNQLKGITEEIERQTNPWNQLSENMTNAGQKLQDVGRGMTDFGKNMSMKVTAPILALGAGALKVGMDFEAGMSQVQAISGATGEDLEKMTDMAKEMGAETRFSATEAASGMEFLAMSGMNTNEILETMPGLLDLAASSGMDLGRAADIATNVLSGFAYEADQAGRVSDVFAKGASTANTNVEQLGSAMEVVAPIAKMVDLEIEGLTASVGKMSDAGIQGEKAGRMLRQGILRLADPTGKAADLIEELGINVFDADGNMKEMDSVVGELNKGLDGMDSQAQAAALSTIFGSESTAGWSALLEVGQDELKKYTTELQNSEGAASEMAEVMQDNAKGAMIEFKSSLEGAGIALSEHMIPAVTNIIEKGTETVRKFGELDDSTQENIIKMGLFAAAIGPAALVLGSMTTAIGGVVKIGGGLVGLLGGTGGLIARVGMLGMTGPVGLAVAGVGLLGAGIYALTNDSLKLHDVNWDLVESMKAEVDATDDLITQFEELESKNKLTTDEMLRYMDILSELKSADGAEAIKALKNEQAELLEKSGFTNDEMETFLGLNDDIIEKSPDTTKAISDQGNAYVENLDALKELNEEKLKELLITAEREVLKALENETKLLEEQVKLVEEIRETDTAIESNREKRLANTELLRQEEEKLESIDQRKLTLKEDMKDLDGEALRSAEVELSLLEDEYLEQLNIVKATQDEQDILESTYQTLTDKLIKKGEDLDVTRDELREIEQLKGEYESLILAQVDITAEKGNGLKAIDEEIKKVEKTKEELEKQTDPILKNTEGYKDNVRQLEGQLGKLKDAQTELENINKLAGKTVYNKKVKVSTDPSINSLNSMLASTVKKDVQMTLFGLNTAAYADGTDHHPGGPFIAGEEGWELGRQGNRWEVLNAGFYDRPSGYEVFTHDESKRIMGAMNRMPAYAGGTNMGSETNRIISDISSANNDFEMVTVLREQNGILMQLLQKENVAYLEFETVYQPVKKRLAEDQYSSHKRRRSG